MTLITPTIHGPLSPCSTRVVVSGIMSGAKVRIQVNGQNGALSNALVGARATVEIGLALQPGDKVAAIQTYNNDTSPLPVQDPVVVSQIPAQLSDLTLRAPLVQCGRRISFEGAIPGAEIEVTNSNGNATFDTVETIYGSAWARVPPLPSNAVLNLVQKSCNGLTRTTVTPQAIAHPPSLGKPAIWGPVIECMTSLRIDNILPGATVVLERDGQEAGRFDCAEVSTTWWGHKPFKEGEELRLRQEINCKRESDEPDLVSDPRVVTVGKAAQMKKPVILTPICPGDPHVTVVNMTPDAEVHFMIDGQPLGYTMTPSEVHSFPLPSIPSGKKLTVQLRLCGQVSPVSEPVEADGMKDIESLKVSKLYACASHVFMSAPGLAQGKRIQIHDVNAGPISALHQIYNTYALVPVAPALQAGQKVRVTAKGCAGAIEEFGTYTVDPHGDLLPPSIVEPVEAGVTQWLDVESQYAGAHLALFRDGVYENAAISYGDVMPTPMLAWFGAFQLGQNMTATQALCGQVSRPSKPATVVLPKPKAPILKKPDAGASGLETSGIGFNWSDPGANTLAAATGFDLQIREDNGPWVGSGTFSTGGTSLTPSISLDHSKTYRWWVVAKNGGGTAKSSDRLFTTKAAPQPPPPQSGVLAFLSAPFASYDAINNLWPVPSGQQFYICIGVGNVGNANSDEAQVIFHIQHGGQSLGSYTVTIPAGQVPGWSDVAYWKVGPFGTGYHLFEAALVVNNTQVDYSSNNLDLQ